MLPARVRDLAASPDQPEELLLQGRDVRQGDAVTVEHRLEGLVQFARRVLAHAVLDPRLQPFVPVRVSTHAVARDAGHVVVPQDRGEPWDDLDHVEWGRLGLLDHEVHDVRARVLVADTVASSLLPCEWSQKATNFTPGTYGRRPAPRSIASMTDSGWYAAPSGAPGRFRCSLRYLCAGSRSCWLSCRNGRRCSRITRPCPGP